MIISYLFEERQDIRFSVYDIDDFRETASVEQNLIGNVDLHVHDIVTAPDCKVIRPLLNGSQDKLGNLVITGEERKRGSKVKYKIRFEGKDFGPELIFYRINRLAANGGYVPIVESETSTKIKGTHKHPFSEIEIMKSALLKDDEEKKAMIEVFSWNKSGSHVSLGKDEFLINELMERKELRFSTGVLKPLICEQSEDFSFLDYILNGLEIALTIAIDFTGSNGNPSRPTSLHYFDMAQNQYLQAIMNVGQILENYDSDKKFSVFGFGASNYKNMPNTSHCFALNGNIFDPEIPTLQGVFDTYKNVLQDLSFNGPTYFAGILNYVNRMIEYECIKKKQNKYYILLLMTDGIIDDMEATIDQIVRATSLPLSIIIIGVGNNNFESMEVLDADDKPLFSKTLNKQMERDIVQFVPYSQYKHDPVRLAKETLEEVPRQLVSYMNSKHIPPVKEALVNTEASSFFDEDRRIFISHLLSKGFTQTQIDTVLSQGIPEANASLFSTLLEKAEK